MGDAATAVIKTRRGRGALVPRTLRELRVDRGWKLSQLAEHSGLHLAVVSQIERGRLAATHEELDALSDALDLPLAAALMVVHWEQQP